MICTWLGTRHSCRGIWLGVQLFRVFSKGSAVIPDRQNLRVGEVLQTKQQRDLVLGEVELLRCYRAPGAAARQEETYC